MSKSNITWHSNADAALFWYRFGLKAIPIVQGSKRPVVKWNPWLAGLSTDNISRHWRQNPAHEVGFIVGDDTIVFDADSTVSIAALTAIENAFNIAPSLVVKTKKGEHHYYRRGKGTYAKSDSHCTALHPERIDVKTGRALVVLPPSTGKTVARLEADVASGLTEARQEFIDAVYLHNGRQSPRPWVPSLHSPTKATNGRLRLLQGILRRLDADCGYDDWLHVGMALHFETRGGDGGLDLFDSWSSTGAKYKGARKTAAKWCSFRSDQGRRYTIRTLIWMAEKAGYSIEMILAEVEPFDTVEGDDVKS